MAEKIEAKKGTDIEVTIPIKNRIPFQVMTTCIKKQRKLLAQLMAG